MDHKILIHSGLNAHLGECETYYCERWQFCISHCISESFKVIGYCADGEWSFQCKGPYNNVFSSFHGDSQSLVWPDVCNSNNLQFYVATPAHTGSISIN